MSAKHQALVFEADGLSSNEKLLLLAYTEYTDAHGYCYPGMARLAAMTGMSESTIKRTRKGLETKALLRHQRRTSAAGDPTSNMYRVNLDKLTKMRRHRNDFDDNVMALDFTDAEPKKTRPDLLIVQSEPTPGQSEPTPVHSDPRVGSDWPHPGVTVTGGWGHSDPLSVTDPVNDPSIRTRGTNGRTDQISDVTEEHRTAASELVDAAGGLGTVGARPSQATQVRDAVAGVLAAGYRYDDVRSYLRSKLAEAKTVKYVLGALEPERLSDISTQKQQQENSTLPPVCGQCEARPGGGLSERQVADPNGGYKKCPRCNPYAHTAA